MQVSLPLFPPPSFSISAPAYHISAAARSPSTFNSMRLSTLISSIFGLHVGLGPGVHAQASSAGVYNTSHTPSSLPWNTYNYCNAPHVNKAHYILPPAAKNGSGAELVYLNAMVRHHKRVPDNLIPFENAFNPPSGWDCTDFVQENHGNPSTSTRLFHQAMNPVDHPFREMIWNGSCDEGQLTREGLEDSVQHGKVGSSSSSAPTPI
jgi:hypothetical protein